MSRNSKDEIENVELYLFEFEVDGKKGFAYSSPDLRVNRVLAYCENGSIADTASIPPMALAIRGMARGCADDLSEYYAGKNKLSRADDKTRVAGPFMITEWSQGEPYNNNCGGSGCTTTVNGKYPAGCVAIAVAQSVASVNRHESQFNLTALKKERYLYSFSPLATEVASYVYHVAYGCQTDFNCGGSSSTLAKAKTYIMGIGYRDGLDFEYQKSSSINNSCYATLFPIIFEIVTFVHG